MDARIFVCCEVATVGREDDATSDEDGADETVGDGATGEDTNATSGRSARPEAER